MKDTTEVIIYPTNMYALNEKESHDKRYSPKAFWEIVKTYASSYRMNGKDNKEVGGTELKGVTVESVAVENVAVIKSEEVDSTDKKKTPPQNSTNKKDLHTTHPSQKK